ncbi:TusE/DsrC/DsvC family sulfur relay protein [Porticoccus sp. W117]|uniref:TusE/DsrC/DsvC family sulfur relay protein n=1 Tax=Porticoccus sp. W117 TaxID=3054777 RepID=UPI0025982ED1|nr:TusE/DsrC/DsvC family sulfur relay protein [Porticoccus sp. W117]MDM3871695.1 TusE/DsrC/DsvC family sulfur relay protein [Porticoccus sp. W117]
MSFATDKEGFLTDLNDWSEDVATTLAKAENIELSEQHWEILHLLRQFQQQFDISPPMRPLVKYVTQHLGPDKGKSIYLTRLFPPNPAKIASKIAGLPKPEGCL